MMIGPAVYALCAVTAALCAALLLRAHQRTKSALLFWSGLCFVLLTVNNVLVIVDLVILPDINLVLLRNMAALTGMVLLLYGLVWKSEQ